jgi:glutamate synthase (NADPH/NADH) small chain
MAEICARLGPAERLCEGTCILNGVSEPVSIGAIEQFLSEYALAHGHVDTSTPPPNGWRVAVVGSGAGGLACADDLARKGYAVTIFDSALVPGGLLVNGTAAFRIEKSIVQRRIEILQKRGVVFRLGQRLGKDLTLNKLRAEYHAVFLGFDSQQARPFEVPGANLTGVVQALPFILQKNTPIWLDLPPLDVTNKCVVVVGGGDTAIDCLRTAIRAGAQQVIGVYRRDEADMSCSRREYHNAIEEGAHFIFRATPVAVLDKVAGEVAGLRLIHTEPGQTDSSGRRSFSAVPGSEFQIAADWVIPALGFTSLPCPHTGDFGELAINDWGGVIVDADQMTNLPGVFAGGDIVRGPSLVLHTVRDARQAAGRIDAYLSATGKASPSPN